MPVNIPGSAFAAQSLGANAWPGTINGAADQGVRPRAEVTEMPQEWPWRGSSCQAAPAPAALPHPDPWALLPTPAHPVLARGRPGGEV